MSTMLEIDMAKIYTRRGDGGQTRLFTGERVSKDEARLEALGCIDELVAFLGFSRSEIEDSEIRSGLTAIQSELYLILSDIVSVTQGRDPATKLPDDAIGILESLIDDYDSKLPPLRDFVMPAIPAGPRRFMLLGRFADVRNAGWFRSLKRFPS